METFLSTPQSRAERAPLFAGADQPLRRSFCLTEIHDHGKRIPINTKDVWTSPFCTLVEFSRGDRIELSNLLIVTPLSGHFAILVRDLVIGLLSRFCVYVTDWTNVRHVPIAHGSFPLDANIDAVRTMIRRLGPQVQVMGICQGAVPALASTALLAAEADPTTPSALILMAGPIDPLANPTRVVRLLRAYSSDWYQRNLLRPVASGFAGCGRLIYPAEIHLAALWIYLARRLIKRDDLFRKFCVDDGSDPEHYPFFDLYTSIMDLDAGYFLTNAKLVYRECALARGTLRVENQHVDLQSMQRTGLLTVEGERDDIAAPGQTSAAHALCTSLKGNLRGSLVVPGVGHFALFHGETCRRQIVPYLCNFLANDGRV